MPLQILLNLIIAVMWMFLNESYHFASFLTGFIFGALLLFILGRFIPDTFYLHRVWKIIKLVLLFLKELLLANLEIVKWVYRPGRKYNPGIFAMPTELRTDWEITMLTSLISLTPGTLSVDVSESHDVIYIHAMDINDKEEAIDAIKHTFEKAIMEVTR